MRIGFLGLGHMGLPMARNLLGREHTLTVYNRTPGRAKALINRGAIEAKSIAEAVKDAEVAITMLSDDAAMTDVVHGPSGLLENLPPKAIHLCMSTIGVETSMALASAHAKANQGYVAAPVFGRADTAESRHLWIVAGGSEPQVNRCKPIFEALGRGYERVSSNAALAHALKLGGNTLATAMEMAVSEILTYANKAGLSPGDYLRLLNTAIFRSHMVDSYRGGTARPSFDPENQTLDLAASEMLLPKARDMGIEIPMEDLLQARIQAAGARGWGEQDLAELSQACRLETGEAPIPVPEPKAPLPNPPVSRTPKRTQSGSNKVTTPKETTFQPAAKIAPPQIIAKEALPQSTSKAATSPSTVGPDPSPSPVVDEVQTRPSSTRPSNSDEPAIAMQGKPKQTSPRGVGETAKPQETSSSAPVGLSSPYTAMDGAQQVPLELEQTSHFEVIKGQVWAWSHGKCYQTRWRTLDEVEAAFNHVLFLLIHRRVLLRPEAVLDLRPVFGGGAKARVDKQLVLDVSRSATPRLKELLGM